MNTRTHNRLSTWMVLAIAGTLWVGPALAGQDATQINWGSIGQHAFNLTVLLAVLFFFGRRPIGDALKNRALGIRKELTDSARERDEAQHRYTEVEARLSRFEEEVKELHAQAQVEANAEEEKLVQRAHDAAKRITETAERNIRDEVVRAQFTLRQEAVELAIQLAQETLKGQIQGDDQRRLARQFLDTLDEGVNGNG